MQRTNAEIKTFYGAAWNATRFLYPRDYVYHDDIVQQAVIHAVASPLERISRIRWTWFVRRAYQQVTEYRNSKCRRSVRREPWTSATERQASDRSEYDPTGALLARRNLELIWDDLSDEDRDVVNDWINGGSRLARGRRTGESRFYVEDRERRLCEKLGGPSA
jgi:hypothetical protein